MYLIATTFEKVTFRKIETLVQKEISKEEFCLETPYGKLQNVSLSTFCLNSKWENIYIEANEGCHGAVIVQFYMNV